MSRQCGKLIIESVSEDGRKFRPSDWIERLSASAAHFGPDHRLHYSSGVRPWVINGEKCLVVDQCLQTDNPEVYAYIMQFAQANRLRMREKPDLMD